MSAIYKKKIIAKNLHKKRELLIILKGNELLPSWEKFLLDPNYCYVAKKINIPSGKTIFYLCLSNVKLGKNLVYFTISVITGHLKRLGYPPKRRRFIYNRKLTKFELDQSVDDSSLNLQYLEKVIFFFFEHRK